MLMKRDKKFQFSLVISYYKLTIARKYARVYFYVFCMYYFISEKYFTAVNRSKRFRRIVACRWKCNKKSDITLRFWCETVTVKQTYFRSYNINYNSQLHIKYMSYIVWRWTKRKLKWYSGSQQYEHQRERSFSILVML